MRLNEFIIEILLFFKKSVLTNDKLLNNELTIKN